METFTDVIAWMKCDSTEIELVQCSLFNGSVSDIRMTFLGYDGFIYMISRS